MRALVVAPGPSWSTADVWRGWCRGLTEIGVEVVPYDLGRRRQFFGRAVKEWGLPGEKAVEEAAEGILAYAYRCWPDVVIFVADAHIPTEIFAELRRHGHRIVVIHTESPYEDDRQIARAHLADIIALNDPLCVESWRAVNPETYYVPHAYDPTVHHPGRSDNKSDVCFVGTMWPERVDLFDRVDWDGIDLHLAGLCSTIPTPSPLRAHVRSEEVDNDTTADIYRGSKIGLNFHRTTANRDDLTRGWSIGPRLVEMAACGLFFATDPRPEVDLLFPHVPTFSDAGELEELLRHYLARDALRQGLAEKSRAAIADRTFAAHAARLMARLDRI